MVKIGNVFVQNLADAGLNKSDFGYIQPEQATIIKALLQRLPGEPQGLELALKYQNGGSDVSMTLYGEEADEFMQAYGVKEAEKLTKKKAMTYSRGLVLIGIEPVTS